MISKRTAYFISLGVIACIFPSMMLIQSMREKSELIPLNDTGNPYEDWRNCVSQNVELMSNKTWIKWPTVLYHCEKTLLFNLNIIDIKWNGEIVRTAVKKVGNNISTEFKSTIFAFGAGLDEKVVETVHKLRGKDFAEFIGGLPLDAETQRRYNDSNFSMNLPVIAANTTQSKPNRTEGWYGRAEFESIVTLWSEKKLYDSIWLDLAAKEHEILPLSYRNGFMDQNDVVVCQWHAMVHFGATRDSVSEFLLRTLAERRYAIVKPVPPGVLINIKHYPLSVPWTIHLLNVENPICRSRYSKKIAGTRFV